MPSSTFSSSATLDPPGTRSASSSRGLRSIAKKLPPGGIAAIAIVIGIEGFFAVTTEPLTGLPYLEPTADDATLVAKRKLLDRAPGSIVLVGDSSCMMGVHPDEISRRAGTACVNLGTLSTHTVAGFAAMGEEALARSPRPRAIVLALLPRSLGVSEARAREFGQLGRYLIAYGARSAAYSPSPADWSAWFHLKHSFNRFPREFGGSYAAFEQALAASGGHFPEPGKYAGGARAEVVELTEFATRAVASLAEACRAANVPFFLWLSPSPEDVAVGQYSVDVERAVAKLEECAPNLRPLRKAVPVWPIGLFGSVTHVNAEGARRNSQEMAAALADVLR